MVLLLAGAAWSFALIAEAVGEKETRGFDEAVLLAMRGPGDTADPPGLVFVAAAAPVMAQMRGIY